MTLRLKILHIFGSKRYTEHNVCICFHFPFYQRFQGMCMFDKASQHVRTHLYESDCTSLTLPPSCPNRTDCTHNEWDASLPRYGRPRSEHILYGNLSEADCILYSSLFARMMSSGHLLLFIRLGSSHLRPEVGWPRLGLSVCVLGRGGWRRKREKGWRKTKEEVKGE